MGVYGVPDSRTASDEASSRRVSDSVVANSFRSPNAPALHAQHAYQSQGQVTTFGAAHFGSTQPQVFSPMQQPHFFGHGPSHMHPHVSAAPAASYRRRSNQQMSVFLRKVRALARGARLGGEGRGVQRVTEGLRDWVGRVKFLLNSEPLC